MPGSEPFALAELRPTRCKADIGCDQNSNGRNGSSSAGRQGRLSAKLSPSDEYLEWLRGRD